MKSRWALTCGDLNTSRAWLIEQLSLNTIPLHQGCHWALSLGMIEYVESVVKENYPSLRRSGSAGGIRFRIARIRGEINPYKILVEDGEKTNWSDHSVIVMTGGIGDHLEDIARINGLARGALSGRTLMSTRSRCNQLRGISNEIRWVESTGARERIHVKELLAYQAVGSPDKAKAFMRVNVGEFDCRYKLLCCWKAEGIGDKLSSWSRSVDFMSIIDFYHNLINAGINPAGIVDISNWSPWEKSLLEMMSIKTHDPTREDVGELAKLAARCEVVCSIDTALAHLAACMEKKTVLMLPKFHDERWFGLLKEGSCYHDNCTVFIQRKFGCWKAVLENVIEEIVG